MKNRKQSKRVVGMFADSILKKCLLLLVFVIPLFAASSVSAEEKSAEQWQYDFQLYLWASTFKNNMVNGDSVTINVSDMIKNLKMLGMFNFSARNDKFSMMTDVIYLHIGNTKKFYREFQDIPVEGKVEIALKSWVLNLIGGYNLIDTGKNQFDITAGARYLNIKQPVTITTDNVELNLDPNGHVWDGVIGVKGRHNYPDGHYFNYYADVGAGDSKLTWQALVNFAYDYEKFTGIIGYRYAKWNFKNDSPILDDLTAHGPYVGIQWSF